MWPVKNFEFWFVGGDDLTGALHNLYFQLSLPPPIILCFNKHRITQIHLENGR